MKEEWIEITAVGPEAGRQAAIDLFLRHGSPAVEELDWTDSSFGGNAKATFALKGFLQAAKKPAQLAAGLKRLGLLIKSSEYKNEDWKEKWKEGLKPIVVTGGKGVVKRLAIKPTWTAFAKKPGDAVIEIDPGMAFGTGHHATTRLCLKALLDSAQKRPVSMLDVGTGTGVLAIAAAKLGVKQVTGTDVDPVALSIARKNAKLNNAQATFSRQCVSAISGSFDVVTANIISSVLLEMKPALCKKIRPGCRLVLSGILATEADGVKNAFLEDELLRFVKRYKKGEWVALVFEKKRGRTCRI